MRVFFGTVDEEWTGGKDNKFHKINYDDGDSEDFNEDQLKAALDLYGKFKYRDLKLYPNKFSSKGKKGQENKKANNQENTSSNGRYPKRARLTV